MIALHNGLSFELCSSHGVFLGLGRITAGGIPLRSGRRPMFVEIRNPSGIALRDYAIARKQVSPTRVVLDFSIKCQQGGIMDWMVHTVRNRYSVTDWTRPPEAARGTRLRLEIRAVNRTIGGHPFVGFSYQYRYKSRTIPVYKILDRGTWEPGGRAVGNEFWMRNCFTPSIVPIASARQFHSTEWYLPSCDNPNIFQFLPLQTELQGFTFTAGRAGVLVTWASEVAHVRSLFEKPRQADELVHWHEHCGDLGYDLATAPVEVLWVPGKFDRVARANVYEAVKELVHDALHAQVGLRRERIGTFGMIEEWGNADMARYTQLGLPKLLDAGMTTVYVANHFENNMNTWGIGNMCSTVDYKVAESVGADRLREFCRKAQAGGARVCMWGNTSISALTPLFRWRNGRADRIRFLPTENSIDSMLKEAKAPFVRNPSNAIEADHYTPAFCVLNLRDPAVRAYWLKRWKEAHDEVGLGGIFLDSSFNLSSDKFHFRQTTQATQSGATADQTHLLGNYRPAAEPPAEVLSQYRAHLDLMREMQAIGYEYNNEDLGVFGTHRHGPGIEARLDSLFLWADCVANFDPAAIRKRGADPEDVFFRGLAYRQMWAVHWDIAGDALSFNYSGVRNADDRPTARHLTLLKAYNEIEARMFGREILQGEVGVRYRCGGTHVLWAFEDGVLPLEGKGTIRDVLAGTVVEGCRIEAQKHRIYVAETAAVPES